MNPRSILAQSARALTRNKMRSALTILGITIGIGAVICVVAIGNAVIAAAFSIAVGVFFGYYPARQASRLDPIQALRFE